MCSGHKNGRAAHVQIRYSWAAVSNLPTLAPVVIDSNRLAWIDQVHAHLGGDEAALLGQMLQQRKYLKIYGGSNNSMRVYALRAARPIWAMLTASIGDRVLWIWQDADRRLSAHVVPYRGGS